MSDPFIGEIRTIGYSWAPIGWALCNGQLLSIAEHAELFAVLGTAYGGDGIMNFGVPDLRGRTPVGWGQGHGLSPRHLGEMGGAETAALTEAQLGAHSHDWQVSDEMADQTSAEGHLLARSRTGRGGHVMYNAATPGAPMAQEMLTPSGAEQAKPHSNIQPLLAVNFIIALQGEFPPRE